MGQTQRNNKTNKRNNKRKNNKNSRKTNTRNSNTKKRNNRKNQKQNGGAYNAGALSLAQGQEYRELHKNQYGGGQMPNPAPVGDTGMLDPALRQMAAVSTLDRSLSEIAGMSDGPEVAPAPAAASGAQPQAGGRRKGKKSNKSKKSKKSNKSKKSKKSKKQRGGAYSPAPINGSGMLLSSAQAARAGTADFSNPWLTK